MQLNIARDETIVARLSTQDELDYYKFENFKKHIINDFKSHGEFVLVAGKEAISFVDKGCVHIIRQLHHHFQDKSVLLQAYEANFDDDICRGGSDFVPYTSEELDALHKNDIPEGKREWVSPTPSQPTF